MSEAIYSRSPTLGYGGIVGSNIACMVDSNKNNFGPQDLSPSHRSKVSKRCAIKIALTIFFFFFTRPVEHFPYSKEKIINFSNKMPSCRYS